MLHQIALLQLVPGCEADEAFDAERLAGFAAQLAPEDVQLYYQIGLTGQKELYLAPDPRSGFEMLLLRMLAFRPDSGGGEAGGQPGRAAQSPAGQAAAKSPARPAVANSVSQAPAAPPAQSPVEPCVSAPRDPARWNEFVAGLKLGGIASQLANHCVFENWDGETLCLLLDEAHRHMRVGQAESRLQAAIADAVGKAVKLKITEAVPESETPAMRQAREQQERQRQAQAEMANDPLVREMEEHFSARLVSDSVRPLD